MFNDFGQDEDAATINLVPAVRNATAADGCVDEQHGCVYERVTLCAFDGQPLAKRVKFLDCMDAPWNDLLTKGKAQKCAKQVGGIDWSAVEKCNAGPRGLALLEAAQKVWTTQFPKPVPVPEVTVNGKVVSADYADIKAAACAAGSSAGVCN